MKEKYFIHTVLLYLLLGSPTVHSKDIGSREEFISYMEEKHGFDYKQLNLLFDKTVISKSILDAIQRPAEKKFLWYQYRKIFLKEKRIKEGVKFWLDNRLKLEEAEKNLAYRQK